MKKIVILVLALVIATIGLIMFNNRQARAPKPETEILNQTNTSSQFDKSQYSLDDTASLWLIVNKSRPIPLDYVPGELVTPNVRLDPSDSAEEQKIKSGVDEQVETMFADAESAGFELLFASGYRSADLQAVYYNNYVKSDGQVAADKYSAKPGTSEHQTGLAFDIARAADRKCYLETCFADTEEGKWLAENAHKYGFTLRYKKGKEAITGYQYEPWHFRYVGSGLAAELNNTNQTLEEFFNL